MMPARIVMVQVRKEVENIASTIYHVLALNVHQDIKQ